MGQRKEQLEIHVDGKKLKQRDSFVYLDGAMCGDGNSDTNIRVRITAGENAWRKVEEVMGDRRISRARKGKVFTSCVTPAYVYGLETMALTKKRQEKVQAKTVG